MNYREIANAVSLRNEQRIEGDRVLDFACFPHTGGGKAMSFQDHKLLSRRATEMWASNNPDRPEDIFSENYVNHQESDVEGGVSIRSLEDWKELVRNHHDAFPNSMDTNCPLPGVHASPESLVAASCSHKAA